MSPQRFEVTAETSEREETLFCLAKSVSPTEETLEPLASETAKLLHDLLRSIGGKLNSFDGVSLFSVEFAKEKISLFGECFWLDQNKPAALRSDIHLTSDRLLCSFKFFDDWEKRNQVLYIARGTGGWVYAH